MKKIINSIDEITSNNVISYVTLEDNPESSYIYFADIINNLYSNYIMYVKINSSNTFIDYVEINYPDNKPFIQFVKIISDIDFYIRKLSDKFTFEELKSFIVSKSLYEYIIFSEETSFNIEKIKLETINISELVSIQITKPQTDSFSILDSVNLTVDFQRIFPEIISFDDSISFDLKKYFEDFFSIEEFYSSELYKPREDLLEFSDSKIKSFNKVNTDTFNFSENLYFNFQKVLSETYVIKEAFSFQFQKPPFIDQYSVSDLFDGVLNKIKFDEIVYFDANYKSFNKGLIETPIIYEQFSYQLEKQPFFDEFNVTDICIKTNNKNTSDNFILADYSRLFLNKGLLDLINIQEIKNIELTKPKFDLLNFVDNYNSNFKKFLSESFRIEELKTIVNKKTKEDIFEILEFGAVLLSDYSIEGTYFAEDYVGETTNF